MIEFEILARGLFRPNQLTITYNPTLTMPTTGTTPDPALTTPAIGITHVGAARSAQFIAPSPNETTPQGITTNSPLHTPPTIQQWMDTLWQQKLTLAQQKNIPLYNTPLYRLIHAKTQPNGNPVYCRGDLHGHPRVRGGGHPAPVLHLTLGNTTYKEYVTTREPTFAQNRPREALSNALSVCSVVETTDRYILLDKRQGVDVYAGRYHVIGGFFERDLDTTETTETTETIETIATSATSATNPDPFAAIRREIREETGIQTADIAEQYCLGVLYDLATPHAELCFLTRLNIPLNEVRQRVPEENEIKQLLPLYVTEESLRNFILTNHGNISATGEPNLLLYGALNFGEAWFEEIMGRL